MLKSFYLLLLITFQIGCGKRYDNYALYVLHPSNGQHVRFLQDLQFHKYMDVIFWSCPNTRNVLLLVNRNDRELFRERTTHFDIKTQLVYENIQQIFDHQLKKENPLTHYMNKFEYYRSLEDIYNWLGEMADAHPTIAKLDTIGKSFENRSILAFSIEKPNSLESFGVMLEAGAHGHEWLSTTFALFLIDQLLTSHYGPISTLRRSYNWYFVPILNPDGYVFSQNTDRLWRKNKRVYPKAPKSIGVDLNRNFPYSWGVHDSSPEPDDDKYRGPQPLSEPETQALASYIHRHRDMLLYYFSVHSFGQKFVIPFGDKAERLGNYDTMRYFVNDAIDKIFSYSKRKYHCGTAFEMFGLKISGDSASWVKNEFKIPYVLTIHLPDNGIFGHALPLNLTLPACREMMLGMTELLKTKPDHIQARVALVDMMHTNKLKGAEAEGQATSFIFGFRFGSVLKLSLVVLAGFMV